MRRLAIIAVATGFLGCGQSEQKTAVAVAPGAETTVENTSENSKASIADPQVRLLPSAQPPMFEFPSDLTGQALEKAVAPETPALTPIERFGTAPMPRTPPAKMLNPEVTFKANYIPPPILPTKSVNVPIAPPREPVPFDLGRGSDAAPSKPTLPIAVVIVERARDVNLPPAMPTLGRPLSERVSLDDPTSDFANAAIVAPAVKVPLASADFMKVTIPDPFELGEQVKPKVPPAVEPRAEPVPVNPQRVK